MHHFRVRIPSDGAKLGALTEILNALVQRHCNAFFFFFWGAGGGEGGE
jgi:hypothetical protein